MQIATIGVDLAKHVFQVHGIGPDGSVVLRHRLRRSQAIAFFAKLPSCLIGMEACATAHHWAREFRSLGHEVATSWETTRANDLRTTVLN